MADLPVANPLDAQASASHRGRQVACGMRLEDARNLVDVPLENSLHLRRRGRRIRRAHLDRAANDKRHMGTLHRHEQKGDTPPPSEERSAHAESTHKPEPRLQEGLRRVEELVFAEAIHGEDWDSRLHCDPHKPEPPLREKLLLAVVCARHLPTVVNAHQQV